MPERRFIIEASLERLGDTIGETIRVRRRELRLTQDDLADLAGCSPRFIRSIESGKASVRLDMLLDVLSALGVELVTRLRDPM